jgi:ABC-type branched-subunit amino acid transport system substrate-binding protein
MNAPSVPGTSIGMGSNKIALILPMGATGAAGAAALSMRNAAEMAFNDSGVSDVQILIKDDAAIPQNAQAAAQSAIAEGAQLILGPLTAPSVVAVGQVARASGVPVIAYSTDENVAARGVYLLSFLPSSDVNRIVTYAASQGRRNFAALIPEDAYGTVVDGEFRSAVSRAGGRIVGMERYPLDRMKMMEPIRKFAPALAQADALFLPDGIDAVEPVLQALMVAKAPMSRVKLLSTGRWDDPRAHRVNGLSGAWYAAPDGSKFRNFAGLYRARYANDPARLASLAYDSTLLACALVRSFQPPNRFSEKVLTDPNGFAGIDGIFRFRQNGANERGIAVHEIRNGSSAVISPAPASFGPVAG